MFVFYLCVDVTHTHLNHRHDLDAHKPSGADDEPRAYLEECTKWVLGGPWVDPRDGFDYAAGIQRTVKSYVRT